MDWKNANKLELPRDGESVIISADGIYHVARYSVSGNKFTVENDPRKNSFAMDDYQIYWTGII